MPATVPDAAPAAQTAMSANSVLALRRQIYGPGRDGVTRDDLAKLIALGRSGANAPGFDDLLAEAAVDLLVRQPDPSGYISAADATWLTAQLEDGGGLSCHAEFKMLVDVMRNAVSVPATLNAFGVREVEKSIVSGRRAATGGVDHQPGVVTQEDVEALRQMVFAATQGSSLHVDEDSAQALFDIAHATTAAVNDPSFNDFFAKAVGNYLIGVGFNGTPDRDSVLSHEAELNKKSGMGDFFAQMASATLPESLADLLMSRQSTEDLEEQAYARQNAQGDAERAAAEKIDAGKSAWVLAHLTRQGALSPAETALLSFIRREASAMPPDLAALAAKAA